MKVKIKSTGYKDEGFPRIIKHLSELNDKQVVIKLDEDSLDGFDLVFDNLKVSNLKFEPNDEEKYYISTFTCTEKNWKSILKLIRSLKELGDCGHSFGVRINGKMFSWDGDGSDRIEEINDIDCGSGIKTFDENYRKFTQEPEKDVEAILKKFIKESIRHMISESNDLNSLIPKKFFNTLNKFKQEYENALQIMDEYPLLDTSTGIESFYRIDNIQINNGVLTYTLNYDDYQKTRYDEKVNLILYDEDYKEYYFNEDDAKEFLSDIKKGLKKGIKYFKEYNPSYDDNEEQRDNFINNL